MIYERNFTAMLLMSDVPLMGVWFVEGNHWFRIHMRKWTSYYTEKVFSQYKHI